MLEELLQILNTTGQVLDTPWAAVRTGIRDRSFESGLNSILDVDSRATGREMLESLGMGENQPGLDWGDLAGFGAEVIPDMILPGAGAYKALKWLRGADAVADAAPVGRGFLDAIDKAVPTPAGAQAIPDEELLKLIGSNPIIEAAQEMPLGLPHPNIPKQLADQMPVGLPSPINQGLKLIGDDRPIYQQWDDLSNQFTNTFDSAADAYSFDAVNKALMNRRFQEKGLPPESLAGLPQVPDPLIESLHSVGTARNVAGDDLMRAVRENATSAFEKRLRALPEYAVGSYRPENAADLLLSLKNMWGEPYLDDVLKQDLGLTGIHKLVNPDYATQAFSNREKTINDIARDLAGRLLSHKNLDFDGVMGPNSALTNEGKVELVDWFRAAAEALYDSSAEATIRHQEFKRGQPLMSLAPLLALLGLTQTDA